MNITKRILFLIEPIILGINKSLLRYKYVKQKTVKPLVEVEVSSTFCIEDVLPF